MSLICVSRCSTPSYSPSQSKKTIRPYRSSKVTGLANPISCLRYSHHKIRALRLREPQRCPISLAETEQQETGCSSHPVKYADIVFHATSCYLRTTRVKPRRYPNGLLFCNRMPVPHASSFNSPRVFDSRNTASTCIFGPSAGTTASASHAGGRPLTMLTCFGPSPEQSLQVQP